MSKARKGPPLDETAVHLIWCEDECVWLPAEWDSSTCLWYGPGEWIVEDKAVWHMEAPPAPPREVEPPAFALSVQDFEVLFNRALISCILASGERNDLRMGIYEKNYAAVMAAYRAALAAEPVEVEP